MTLSTTANDAKKTAAEDAILVGSGKSKRTQELNKARPSIVVLQETGTRNVKSKAKRRITKTKTKVQKKAQTNKREGGSSLLLSLQPKRQQKKQNTASSKTGGPPKLRQLKTGGPPKLKQSDGLTGRKSNTPKNTRTFSDADTNATKELQDLFSFSESESEVAATKEKHQESKVAEASDQTEENTLCTGTSPRNNKNSTNGLSDLLSLSESEQEVVTINTREKHNLNQNTDEEIKEEIEFFTKEKLTFPFASEKHSAYI